MLVVNYTPSAGWSVPEIKPYGPLSLDPMSSCLQYCPNVFEGMKVCPSTLCERGCRPFHPPRSGLYGTEWRDQIIPTEQEYGAPCSFCRSCCITCEFPRPPQCDRLLLLIIASAYVQPFNTDELLVLIKQLIKVESRWIPDLPGYSLYIRPTVIGTREGPRFAFRVGFLFINSPIIGLALAASDSACIYVVVTPTCPYFSDATKGISLLAVSESVRAWPGGTGAYKLGLNYAPGFLPQRHALKQGYDQVLWLLGEEDRVTEVGAMNFFLAVQREDGGTVFFWFPGHSSTC